jgi:hypothetical protein
MGLNLSVQQFLFLEEHTKQLDQDEIIEFLFKPSVLSEMKRCLMPRLTF